MEYNFPQELVENILIRLPLRSLLRFKCLSKQWYLAFSDSKKFITGQDFFLHYIDYHTPGLSRLRIPTSFDGSEGNTVEAVDVECPLAGTSNEEIICVAHCNGILCMLNHTYSQPEHYVSTVIVWNPLTMERKRFQLTGGRGSWEAFGFGYDASIDDYKIMHVHDNVHITDFQPALDVYQCRSMNVLRMKTGQWNLYRNDSLDDIPYGYRISEKNRVGTAVNGCLYWIAGKCKGSVILCFELERDTLREETSLGSCNISADSNLLGVWEDSLCLLCDFDCIHFDMWVMIEESHGVTKTKSWIKLFKFPKVEAMCIKLEPVHPVLTLNGQLLIESNRKGFFLFNPKNGLVKNIAIHGLQFPDAWFNVIPYVESLVSLNA